jgi:hypothetical protein
LHNGIMRIRSTPGAGTIVLVRLPIEGPVLSQQMPAATMH